VGRADHRGAGAKEAGLKKSKKAPPLAKLMKGKRKSAAEEIYPHLKSALAMAGPIGTAALANLGAKRR
jgi:hypothetical protein